MRFILLLAIYSGTAYAQLGVPVFSGSCAGSQAVTLVPDSTNRYKVGLQLALAKMNASVVARKSCAFRMPVKLKEKEKLVVTQVEQDVKLTAGPGVETKTNLEIFLSGQKSVPLQLSLKAIDSVKHLGQTLKSEGIVTESGCGNEVIVAGNLAASVVGSNKGTVRTFPVLVTIEIVSCL